jgi:membrane associated rhomboid family serine protease
MQGALQQSPVAVFILILTVATSIIAWQYEDLFRLFALNPWSLVREQRYYTFLTSGLIHANGMHLLFNMISYYYFAFPLEQLIGHWQFLILYVASLILSDISTVVRNRDNPNYFCVGASGAVTAVIFSVVLYAPKATILLFGIVPMPLWLFGIAFVGYSYYSARYRQTHVNHAAHLWGAISGLALTLILDPRAIRIFLYTLRQTSN